MIIKKNEHLHAYVRTLHKPQVIAIYAKIDAKECIHSTYMSCLIRNTKAVMLFIDKNKV